MNIVELIRKKRDNCPLDQQEIEFFVTSAANHSIDDSQTGAMLMAIYLNGMTDEETLWLTKAFINSGEVLSWGPDAADKHSTGGVGDKISIPLAPALAACGLKVPMISGRGLDFTGGTLDKLESIPGFKTELSIEEMKNCMEKCNFFIAEATSSLCPGDKAIYKIRDITCTVECVPLIVASILGKKFVEGAKYLVLDLKVGPAAFYKKLEDAEILASKMIRIAELLGMKLKIVFTKMESPIGVTVGSSFEIAESLVILKGGGPSSTKELVKRLGGELLFLTGKARSYLHGKRQIQTVLDNGTALQYFEKCLVCQGVDPAVAKKLINDDPWDVLGRSDQYMSFKALSSGIVQTIDGMTIAKVCRDLGGGRTKPSDKIDHTVGAMLSVCVGFEIEERQEWLRVYYKSPICEEDIKKLMSSILIADGFIQEELIIKVIPE